MRRLETLQTMLTHALREASDQQAHHYNLRRRDVEFHEGDLVLRRSHPLSNAAKRFSAALVAPFEGPVMIKTKISRVRYQLVDFHGKNQGEWCIQDLKPYRPKEDYDHTPEAMVTRNYPRAVPSQ